MPTACAWLEGNAMGFARQVAVLQGAAGVTRGAAVVTLNALRFAYRVPPQMVTPGVRCRELGACRSRWRDALSLESAVTCAARRYLYRSLRGARCGHRWDHLTIREVARTLSETEPSASRGAIPVEVREPGLLLPWRRARHDAFAVLVRREERSLGEMVDLHWPQPEYRAVEVRRLLDRLASCLRLPVGYLRPPDRLVLDADTLEELYASLCIDVSAPEAGCRAGGEGFGSATLWGLTVDWAVVCTLDSYVRTLARLNAPAPERSATVSGT